MADKRKRLIRAIMRQTGRTYQGAVNVLRDAREGKPEAIAIVASAKASSEEGRSLKF